MTPVRTSKRVPDGTTPRLQVTDGRVHVHHEGGFLALPEAEACRRLLLWPEMMAALEAFVWYYDPLDGFDGDEVYNVRQARAVLAKARA